MPPLPGVPQVPIAESFARLNEYPEGSYGELREAAAAYRGVLPEQIVVGAGADDLILLVARAFLAPGRTAALRTPTYSLYEVATGSQGPRSRRATATWSGSATRTTRPAS